MADNALEAIQEKLKNAGIILESQCDQLTINNMEFNFPTPSAFRKGQGYFLYISIINPLFDVGDAGLKRRLEALGFDVKFSGFNTGGRMFVFEEK